MKTGKETKSNKMLSGTHIKADRKYSFITNAGYLSLVLFLIANLYMLQACEKDEVGGNNPVLEIADDNKEIVFLPNSSSSYVPIKTNAEELKISGSQDWCTAVFLGKQKKIQIEVNENIALQSREAVIEIQYSGLNQKINVLQFGVEPTIIMYSDTLITDFKEKSITTELYSNVDIEVESKVAWIEVEPALKSVSINPVKYTYNLDIAGLSGREVERDGLIIIKQTEGTLKDTLVIKQKLTDDGAYQPEETPSFESDKKLRIISSTLTPSDKYQSGQNIDKSYDGYYSTVYHSPWSGMPPHTPITLEYHLDPDDSHTMNYLVLYPRSSQSNGVIKTATVWVTTEANASYVKVADIDAPNSNSPIIVRLATPLIEPRSVKIEVTDAYSSGSTYYVSLAEIECYESTALSAIENDLQYFTDMTFSELKPGASLDDITGIENPFIQNIAIYLLAGQYPEEFRIQHYEPYRPVYELAAELKTSAYNLYENPTGIYFEENQEVVVFVEENVQNLILKVRDFGPSANSNTYVLNQGLNTFKMKGKGNGYIAYYTADWETAPAVKIHIPSGKVNGYFDISRHSNEEGYKLLKNAPSDIFDLRGQYVQLAYGTNALQINAAAQLKELVVLYDSIVGSQYSIMGLKKYNRVPKNHMLGRIIWDGFMHADGLGAAFDDGTMGTVANPQKLKVDIWGVAHEFGHVNQVRPGMKWVGTTECTNNIYSAWIQYCFTPDKLRLEHENVNGEIGGRYNGYFENGIINGQEWGLQVKNEDEYGIKANGRWGGDHFIKLVPLWQLQLYYHVAGEGNSWGKRYFYGDVFEKVRNTDESSLSHGEMQINFVKNTCDAVQQDLSDFFIKIGMLKAVNKYFDDYTSAQKTITQSMIDEAISHAAQYPKPETDYIHYISGNSVDAYKNKKQVSGTYQTGISGTISKKIVHSEWQNVVVFETYEGTELSDITMVGTGSSDNAYSMVPYPEGATRIEAVGYDGTRILVYGKR